MAFRTQSQIFGLIERHGLLRKLAEFDPHWIGSTALDVHIDGSDLDICCCGGDDLKKFAAAIRRLFEQQDGFAVRLEDYRGAPSCFASFDLAGQPVEVWGRMQPVAEHEFYRFYLAEQRFLRLGGERLQARVRDLKKAGHSTETAFARALNLKGGAETALLDSLEADAIAHLELLSAAGFP